MDYDKLIEQLKRRGLSNGNALGPHSGLYDIAADAIETLRAELETERAHRIHAEQHADAFLRDCEQLNAELERVTAERDGAVKQLHGYCPACKNYTTNHNKGPCEMCKHEYYQYQDIDAEDNWEWRGIQKDDGHEAADRKR